VADRLLSPAELAAWLSVDRSWVYEHAEELGVLRLGGGPRARLRFDVEEVVRRLRKRDTCSASRESDALDPAQDAAKRRRRRNPLGTGGELLPIRGRIDAA
jgi:hypothetical protein